LQVKCLLKANCSLLSLLFGQESTDLDSITTAFREINLYDTPIGKISLNLRKQRAGILKVREGTGLKP
jgi:hypothetical protein